jgi:serine/threonine protein kinase
MKYNENVDIDKFNIVKHIGKGSFSNVYLCKAELDMLFEDIDDYQEYFIIKEININKLVEKYMSNSKTEHKFRKMPNKSGYSNVSVDITPYNNNKTMMISNKSMEREYYYYKLKSLIETEIDILRMLSHESIIKFNDYMETNYIYYLNLEYCDKGDVYHILKNNNNDITNEFIYEFTKQTANGLAYLHENNIIHRDIKLQNILVKTNDINRNYKYIFKLSDFGFSCYDMSDKNIKDEYDKDDMLCKKYYKLCGTPYFMAPEIILNMNKLENFTFYNENKNKKLIEFYDKRIDIWSYGISLYELITNKMPFLNIRNFKDLEKLYKKEDIQTYINIKLDNIKDETLSEILYMTLKVDGEDRCYINDICNKINNINNINNINTLEQDIVNGKQEKNEISYFSIIKHIVSNPINTLNNTLTTTLSNVSNMITNSNEIHENNKDIQKRESYTMNSWVEINNSSSLIFKLSVERGFLEWLFKK